MFARSFAVASILLVTAFAGCLGGEEAPADPVDQTQETGDNGVIDANESTAAPDGRGQISAFNETNKTEMGAGGMEHTHDAWGGAERLEDVFSINSGLIPFPLTPCKEAGTCTAGGSGETYPAGTAIADYDVPEPALVFEGTKFVEFELVEFYSQAPAPGNPAGKVYFDYLTAADEPGQFRTGSELTLGQPVQIEIKPTEADMPHQMKSLWIFRIYSNTEMVSFEFNISVSLVKGYDVVNWPPHPDLYADRTERIIYEGSFTANTKGTADSNIYGSDSQWFNPQRVISWGTDRLEIQVSNVQLKTDAPVTPAGYLLEYHNASKPPLLGHGAQYGGRLSDESSDGTSYNFVIDLANDVASYDTPYGEHSRWGFRFVPNFDTAGQACLDDAFLQQILVGCQVVPWTITYDLKIVAYGHSTAAGETPA